MSKLKFYLIFGLISAAILGSTFLPPKAQADYNMNLIVSDAYFTNYNSMTAAQINNFLIAQGSVYANYVIPRNIDVPYPYAGGHWDTVLVEQINSGTSEIFYGKTVAQLIYGEAQTHHINPRVILAIMQKESSTITQSEVSSTRMAWPLFYAFNDTMATFGYDQATSQNIAIDFGGAGQQIAYATWNFRDKFDKWNNGTLGNWRAAMSIGGTTVYPQSIATRLLYTYTPGSWQTFLNVLAGWGWGETGTPRAISTSHSGAAIGVPGTIVPMSVTFKNTSNYTWSNSVQLAVDNTQNQAFLVKFNDGTWLSTYRIASLPVSTVAPGASVTFTLT